MSPSAGLARIHSDRGESRVEGDGLRKKGQGHLFSSVVFIEMPKPAL